MRIDKDKRAAGIIDGDYCLQVASDMLERFQEEELENDGFNSLEMLAIKAVFDDLFENNIKSKYKEGRNEVLNLLNGLQSYEDREFMDERDSFDSNIVNIFDYANKED
ncbi:hypothetical protein [Halonatronum saccharophilum]|uniref:hypothetical protein n=1 Tax=Halonatronum saccharophilum TaxID=150060 RepID=UPI0004836FED|nr:hypothetical protein [Halonatronum saccharophilum]